MQRKVKFKKVEAPWVRVKERDVQSLGEWLLGLAGGSAEKISGLPASKIVAAAKSPRSPAHKYLYGIHEETIVREWRETRARELCRSLTWYYVEFKELVAEAMPAVPPEGCDAPRLIDNVKGFDNYFATTRILNEPDLRKAKVKEALSELKTWRSKYWVYSELSTEVEWIEERLRHHGLLKRDQPPGKKPPRRKKRR